MENSISVAQFTSEKGVGVGEKKNNTTKESQKEERDPRFCLNETSRGVGAATESS